MARTLVRRDRRRAPADRRGGRNAPLPGAPQPEIAFSTLGPLSPEEKFELSEHLVQPGGISPGAEQLELSALAIKPRLSPAPVPPARTARAGSRSRPGSGRTCWPSSRFAGGTYISTR